MSSRGKIVFVGNCSYDLTEEQLVEIFREAGPVLSFRLVMDRETGRSRGYGFCEYADAETASSAVRNLNNYEIGGRRLRVDFADSEASVAASGGGASGGGSGGQSQQQQQQQTPAGKTNTAAEAITALLVSMSSSQLFDVLSQMKLLVQTSQEQAKSLLTQNPQLCYALFQAMIIMKVIRPEIVTQVLQNALQQQGVQTGVMPPVALHQQQAPQQMPYQTVRPPPGGVAMQQPSLQQQQPRMMPPSPAPATMQPPKPLPPPPSQSAAMLPPSFAGLPEAQRNALIQIMHMTDAQVKALPPAQQQQVQALKAQLAGGGGGAALASPPAGAGVMRR